MTSHRTTGSKKLFLSAVTSEFEEYRKLLADDLRRPTLDVAVQENFAVSGGLTLEKIDEYLQACDGVVHLIGKAAGAAPVALQVKTILQRYSDLAKKLPVLAESLERADPGLSYTQWEAYLAVYHERPVFIYRTTDFEAVDCSCPRGARFIRNADEELSQKEHYRRICALGRDLGQFLNPERLSSTVLRDLVDILPRLEARTDVVPTKLRHTAEILIGRDADLAVLDDAWNDERTNIVVLHGKGGEGKTALVATWMAELALKGWRGAERVLDESFYSQGTRDQSGASADAFIQAALERFGDPDPTRGSGTERGARLAEIVASRRTLLVLDGLEPLQYPPGPLHGQLKDPGMAALLRGLAAQNLGLCVVTTRERVDEIRQHYGKTAIDLPLEFLAPDAGATLLYHSGAQRAGAKAIAPEDEELREASREVRGHALTLSLVGRFLRLTEGGDIRRRDRMKLADADREYSNDATRPYGHAFKAMEAYETWLSAGDQQAKRQLAILRLLGLFDRPASKTCLEALRAKPAIRGLTDTLAGGSEKDWTIATKRIEGIRLVDLHEDGSIDGHPLLREYFAMRMRQQHPEAWRAAHSRLFDHLCRTAEHSPDTLAGLQPLYQAVVHGCLAGRHQESCEDVYVARILRGTGPGGFYSMNQLSAVGADLGALGAFFEETWRELSPNLSPAASAWLLNEAATRLRALGRLIEALEPMQLSLQRRVDQNDMINAAIIAGNLSELKTTLGYLKEALADSCSAIDFADRSRVLFQQCIARTIAADAHAQAGEGVRAEALFAEAERMQTLWEPSFPQLYSLRGFNYVACILAPAERAAWAKVSARCEHTAAELRHSLLEEGVALQACIEGERRATQTLAWASENGASGFTLALDYLTLARAGLYRCLLKRDDVEPKVLQDTATAVENALRKLRLTNQADHLPQGLLTAALYAGTIAKDPDTARLHLEEAQHIAERGQMPLHLADVQLHRARLFRDRIALAEARRLIETHGYWRRRGELEDAEAAGAGWTILDAPPLT